MKCLKCSTVHQAATFPPFLCPTCEEERAYAAKDQAWWDDWNASKGSAPAPEPAVAAENLATYAEELTEIGPQLVIPGCERRPVENAKPVQLGLFG